MSQKELFIFAEERIRNAKEPIQESKKESALLVPSYMNIFIIK